MKALGSLAFVLLAAAPMACGGKENASPSPAPSPSPSPRTSFSDAAAPDAATVCNTVQIYGFSVNPVRVSGDPPAPVGGSVPVGSYQLESAEYYGPGSPSPIGKMALDIFGSVASLATSDSVDRRSTAIVGIEGPTTLTFTATCRYPDDDAMGGLPATAAYS